MGMPRKGSRRVEVGGDVYLWRVSDGQTRYRNLSGGTLILTAQIDKETPGRVMQVWLLSKRFAEADPYLLEHGSGHNVALTPAEVKILIEYALLQGWDPAEKGSVLKVGPGPDMPSLTDYRVGRWGELVPEE